MKSWFKLLGPGILFAAAAIGVSHLVQSTKAGAEYGMTLLWAVILVHIFKYPFFQFGPRYAAATGENLLVGFKRLGNWVLITYFILNLMTMFTIQAAVGLVTAGIAQYFFGWPNDIFIWMVIITSLSTIILIIGKYKLLDSLMKIVVIILTFCTIIAVDIAFFNSDVSISYTQQMPTDLAGVIFLIALMGWMPAPLDVVVWQSLWTEKKRELSKSYNTNKAIFDFNIGYGFTIFLAVCFLSLGALVMHSSGEVFSSSAIKFSNQIVQLYSSQFGDEAKYLIGIAALATMFSTFLTTMDASPRAMTRVVELLSNEQKSKENRKGFIFWLFILGIGTLIITGLFITSMGLMVQIATVFSFLMAPIYAIAILVLIKSKHTPEQWRPGKLMTFYSYIGILFLLGFSVLYLYTLY